jgi:hypothetical protein
MNLSVDLPTRRQRQMMQQSGARFLFQVGPQSAMRGDGGPSFPSGGGHSMSGGQPPAAAQVEAALRAARN